MINFNKTSGSTGLQQAPPPPPPPPPPLQNSSSLSSYSSSSTSSSTSSAAGPPCSFSTNNLNRLKFTNISNHHNLTTASKPMLYQPKVSQYPTFTPNKSHYQYQQSHQPVQNSISMRNINEIGSAKTSNELNYNNLQQALKAATAALQNNKISTSNMANISKSNTNLTNGGYMCKQPVDTYASSSTMSLQPVDKTTNPKLYRNTLNLLIENESKSLLKSPTSQQLCSSLTNFKVDTSDYDNIEDNIDISVNLTCINSKWKYSKCLHFQ